MMAPEITEHIWTMPVLLQSHLGAVTEFSTVYFIACSYMDKTDPLRIIAINP
jgi:hypothetical protein